MVEVSRRARVSEPRSGDCGCCLFAEGGARKMDAEGVCASRGRLDGERKVVIG